MIYLIISGCIIIIYLFFIFPTQWLKVEKLNNPIGINKRILQISDLHFDRLRVSARRIREEIKMTNPHYIFLTGDFTYRERYLSRAAQYFKVIADCGVPVYAVLGNHDYELPNLKKLLDLFEVYGIKILLNESVLLEDFQLVGIDDYGTGHSNIKQAFRFVDDSKPIIIITHDPNVVLKIERPYHYLMAGHLHGKQLNVPFFFAIKPKGPLSAKGIYKGLHTDQRGTFYISKGIGQAGVNARFMVRSEITIHDL
ncbi:metallophosphoesterase [Paenibacillus sp. LHD-38]|uniref:metallophosphoesterase n=1 Tax=Paenibacillus sp. LHD-38 TaxID=3072143 RepID=UPI00280E1BB8|nr:metallophosphoesterase [Paenibacillus sp. LHD-38]MDQ8735964.1 metallophosphoesterase [Paenibacillus sp. LHD-38]